MITLLFPNYVSITNPPLSGVVWQGYKVRPGLVDPVAALYGFNGPCSRSSLLRLALQLLQQSFLAMETRQGRGVCFRFSFSSTNRLASQVRLLLGVLSKKLEKAKGLGGSGELHPSKCITSLCRCPDGKVVLLGLEDGTILLHDVEGAAFDMLVLAAVMHTVV
ncbi:uncharacterized protein LOC104442410 [Eucalyptus grandis]|uniref:uncharacterized protein LOC104442410 n=1 Tax=Eucalyptus grandis TaxID=71139 RepID=UPI00192F0B6D|nr:uncharacterized protein LOC104442410 [Eucalyptus grandis]